MAEHFTPIQQSILQILSDGLPHSRDELHECCKPSGIGALRHHICDIRKMLLNKGENIVCVLRGTRIYYQHVRMLVSPYDAQS